MMSDSGFFLQHVLNLLLMFRLKFIPKYLPTAAVVGVILYLTLLPQPLGEEPIELFPHADKVVHFLMFGGLTGTVIYDRWRFDTPLSVGQSLIVALMSSLLGAAVEWLQFAMELGRSGNDVLDAAANTVGAVAAVPVCVALHWVNVVKKRGSR